MGKNHRNRRKKIIGLILAGVVLFSICFEVFNLEYLQDSFFLKKFRWEKPISAYSNEDGYMAVIDSAGTRLTLVSPDGKVKNTIQYAMFRSTAPVCEDSVCIDNDRITVVDHVPSDKHANGFFDRILTYDFKGNYMGTVCSDRKQEAINIFSVATCKGKTYAAATDCSRNVVLIGEINKGKINPVHSYDCDFADIFGIRYNPVSDITTVVKNNGDIVTWQGDKARNFREYPLSDTDVVVSDAVATDEGEIAAIDSNRNAVIQFNSKDDTKKLAATEALNLSACGNVILCSDQNNNAIKIIDKDSGRTAMVKKLEYSNRIKVFSFLAWLILAMGIIALILLVITLIITIAGRIKASRSAIAQTDPEADQIRPLTNVKLYGPLMGVAALAFAITAMMIGSMFYSSAVETSRITVSNVSSTVVQLSGETFGDNLKNINSQSDYGGRDYIKATANVAAACENNRTIAGLAELSYSLYKFKADSDDIMVVFDYFGQMKTGSVLSRSDQKKQGLNGIANSVSNGNEVQDFYIYSNGVEYYESFSPVYDSEGEVVGITRISINESKFKERILQKIIIKAIEAFTFLFGLVLLFIEFALFLKFYRIKKKNDMAEQVRRTIPEAHRTMDIVFRIPAALFIIFIYSMVDEVLKHQGRQETVLLVALPITIYAVVFFVCRIVAGLYVKFSPKRYAYMSAIWTAGASLILLIAMRQESYLLLNAGAVAIGISSGVGMISAKSIRITMDPSIRYKYIIPERKEVLATAIAASIGTVLRAQFGKTSIIYFMLFMAAVAIAAAFMLMEDDINLSRDKKRNKKTFREIGAISRRFLKKPNMFVFMILVTLPLPFLALLGTYVLPQVNSFYGLPEVFIGAISIVVSVVSLLLSSFVWREVDKQKDQHWPPVMMGALAVLLLMFSLITTMRIFVIVLIAVALVESILLPVALRQLIRESENEGLDVRDTSPMHELFAAIGIIAGPVILTAMMMVDIKLIGLVWGIVCLACAIAAKRIFAKSERIPK